MLVPTVVSLGENDLRLGVKTLYVEIVEIFVAYCGAELNFTVICRINRHESETLRGREWDILHALGPLTSFCTKWKRVVKSSMFKS